MHKYTKNKLLPNFTHYYNDLNSIHEYNTQQKESNFFLPRTKSKFGQKALFFVGVKILAKLVHSIETNQLIIYILFLKQ